MDYLRKIFIVPLLFFLFVTAGTLAAQDPPFEIEDWEKGINERQPAAEILDAIGAGPGMVIEDPIPLLRNILPSLKPGGCLAIVECDPAK
ncbi:MAG: hypothetical protein JW775_02640, partial [Candidatus Aminicenantes bacterium]|nr:hypothetical protein [Candidatus Aminicenantes bacterium]